MKVKYSQRVSSNKYTTGSASNAAGTLNRPATARNIAARVAGYVQGKLPVSDTVVQPGASITLDGEIKVLECNGTAVPRCQGEVYGYVAGPASPGADGIDGDVKYYP